VKRQYLGDSKDSFKWDYHDFLATALGFPRLHVALMLTPDDGGSDGRSNPERFPARAPVLDFCGDLRASRDIGAIAGLPRRTGAPYRLTLHKLDQQFTEENRAEYFSGLDGGGDALVFLDPDNGFEPDRSCSDKHVRYGEVVGILGQLSAGSVVTVFQHFRRVPFPDDFARIRRRLEALHSTAVYWQSLMFVAAGKSERAIRQVAAANRDYAGRRPVQILA
jgi:hypothetical protein